MTTFEVVDLSSAASTVEARGQLDIDGLREQLVEIRDALLPVIGGEPEAGRFGLQELEIALSVGFEGKVWFIAKGTAEASITLTFGRPTAT